MEKGNSLFHKLDRYLGIPIVIMLGLLKKKRNFPYDKILNKIAIINLGSIGDNVLMSAVIEDLKSQYPSAEIIAFTGNSNYGIVNLIYGVKAVKLPITNFFKSVQLIRRYSNFDVAIDFGPWPRLNAIYTYFIKANYSVGFKSEKQYRHYAYDIQVEHSHRLHEIDNHRNLIKFIYKGLQHKPKIGFVETDKTRKLIDHSGKYCIIHAWSGGLRKELKQWPNEYWEELVSKIYNDFDTILLTGGPSDASNANALYLLMTQTDKQQKIKNIAGELSLAETVYLVKQSSLVVSVDTGNAHIAAAVDANLICLQGPASSLRWRPYNDKAIVVNPSSGNYGYLSFGFELNKAKDNCMEHISPDSVYKAYLSRDLHQKVYH